MLFRDLKSLFLNDLFGVINFPERKFLGQTCRQPILSIQILGRLTIQLYGLKHNMPWLNPCSIHTTVFVRISNSVKKSRGDPLSIDSS